MCDPEVCFNGDLVSQIESQEKCLNLVLSRAQRKVATACSAEENFLFENMGTRFLLRFIHPCGHSFHFIHCCVDRSVVNLPINTIRLVSADMVVSH